MGSTLAYSKNNTITSYDLIQTYPLHAEVSRSFHDTVYALNPLFSTYNQKLQTAIHSNDRPEILKLTNQQAPQQYQLTSFKEDITFSNKTSLSYHINTITYDTKGSIASYNAVLTDKKQDSLFTSIAFNRTRQNNVNALDFSFTNKQGFDFVKTFKDTDSSFQHILAVLYNNRIPLIGDESSWITLKELTLLKMPVLASTGGTIRNDMTVYDICKNIKQEFDPNIRQASSAQKNTPAHTGFLGTVTKRASEFLFGIGRLIRNTFYMVTGKWDDVQDLRHKITEQAKEKPTALYAIIKDENIKHLNLADLKKTYEALLKIPKEQIFADAILYGNTSLTPRLNDAMNPEPIYVTSAGNTFLLKKPVKLEEKTIPKEIPLNPTEEVTLAEAVLIENRGNLVLQEGILESSEGSKFYINNEGLILNAQTIQDNFTKVTENLTLQKELLINIDKTALKEDIAQFNLLFGKDIGELQLNEADLSFLQSLVQKVSDNLLGVPDNSILAKQSFLTESSNALDVITESAGKIEIAQSALSDFQKRIDEFAIEIGQTPQGLSPEQFEIVKDKMSELDYIEGQLMIDELTRRSIPFIEGAVKGDFIENPSWQNIVGQIAFGLTPLGWATDVRDATAGLKIMKETGFKDGKLIFACSLIGFIPAVGDAAKIGIKSTVKNSDAIAKTGKKIIKIIQKSDPQNITAKTIRTTRKSKSMAETLLRKSKSIRNLVVRNADEVNKQLLEQHIKLGGKIDEFVFPYKPGTIVYEYKITKSFKFRKGYNGTDKSLYKPWLDKSKMIENNPNKYFDTRAVPEDYKFTAVIEVKEGTTLRTGIPNEVKTNAFYQGSPARKGGGVQFEVVVDDFEMLKDIYHIIDDGRSALK